MNSIIDHIFMAFQITLEKIIESHFDYIASETLADKMDAEIPSDDFYIETIKVEGQEVTIGLKVHR